MKLKELISNITLILGVGSALMGCTNECDPATYYVSFYLFDKQTGKPYFEISKDKPDSLKIRLSNGYTYPGTVVDRDNIGYRILPYGLTPEVNDTLYFYFNRFDTDTLILTKEITRVYGRCNTKDFITTVTYNRSKQGQIPRDSIMYIKLFK